MPGHRTVRVAVVVLAAALAAVGCGRIGYDERFELDLADAAIDAPAACPSGAQPLCAGAPVCIDTGERGYETWTAAGALCADAGGRLCTDAEWALACTCEPALVDMFLDQGGAALEWEWLAEEADGVAWKRGYDACEATSTHPVTDRYDFRCCFDR